MRRRGNGHKVDTFPFLAVLLCAMGSLILLLLVLDRRAKIVAQAKARAESEQYSRVEEESAAARRAELERRQQALRATLLQEEAEVSSNLRAAMQKRAAADADHNAHLRRQQALDEQLRGEETRLLTGIALVQNRQRELAQGDQQVTASRVELVRLSADLEQMERTLSDLKALRQRQQQTWSLVPYKGKSGDNRRPLYVECTASGIIFHPDRKAMEGAGVTAQDIRAEVERRAVTLQAVLPASERKPDSAAYLLMLVRPNGIATYYKTLAALSGMKLDFGYEFIDGQWVLDFPSDENAPANQQWSNATTIQPAITRTPATSVQAPRVQGYDFGGKSDSPVGGGIGPSAEPQIAGHPTTGGTESGMSGQLRAGTQAIPGRAIATQPPTASLATAAGPPGYPARSSGAGGVLAGTQASPAEHPGWPPTHGDRSGIPKSEAGPGGRGGTPPGTWPPAAEQTGASTAPRAWPEAPRNGLSSPGPASNPAASRASMSGQPGAPLPAQAGPDALRNTSSPPSEGGEPAGTQSSSAGTPGFRPLEQPPAETSRNASPPASIEKPGTSPSFLPQMLPPAETASTTGATPQDRVGAARSAGVQEPEQAGLPDPLARVLQDDGKKKRPQGTTPRPLFRSNRDWSIAIECRADGVMLQPTGAMFRATELGFTPGVKNPLTDAVERLIARRQGTVAGGEPPYRPQIKFLVRPEGLRAYYLAYPALESLRLPMSRENLDAADDKRSSEANR